MANRLTVWQDERSHAYAHYRGRVRGITQCLQKGWMTPEDAIARLAEADAELEQAHVDASAAFDRAGEQEVAAAIARLNQALSGAQP